MNSPCRKDCPNRCADPNCHNPEICDLWREYAEKKAENDRLVHEGRQKAQSEHRQLIDSCRRNRYFQKKMGR